jgi:copper oxidase (laccase) domain-containing protein
MNAERVLHAGLVGFRPKDFSAGSARLVFAARDPANGAGNLSLSGERDRATALAARAAWSDWLGVRAKDWVCGSLVHGSTVRVVGEAERGRGARDPADVLPACDGLITATPGLPLYLPIADCAAVVLHQGGARPRLGLFHAGWRGLAAGILSHGLRRMREGGAGDEPLQAWISPCARAGSYEVGEEFTQLAPAAAQLRDGRRLTVDIGRWCAAELTTAGLDPAHIHDSGIDTISDGHCFSYRRDGVKGGRNGMIAVL